MLRGLRSTGFRRLAVALVAVVALAGSLSLRPPVRAEEEGGSEADWSAVRGLLSGIEGVATTPPSHLVTTHFTDGMLLGNGDIGVTVGGTTSTQRFLFGKSDFWGSTLNPGRNRLEDSIISLGGLTLSSPTPSVDPAPVYRMEQDILNAEVRTTMRLGTTVVSMRSWTADSDNVFVTELSSAGGSDPVTIGADLALPTTPIFPATAGVTDGALWVTRETNLVAANQYHARAAIALRLQGAAFESPASGPDDASASFVLQPGRVVRLVTVFRSDGRIGLAGPAATALRDAALAAPAEVTGDGDRVENLLQGHRAWWKRYWLRSFVHVNDSVLEDYYYGALYVMGSASRSPNLAPSMWGPWITSDGMATDSSNPSVRCQCPAFGGRYFENYNEEAPFYGVFSANRPQLALPYADFVFRETPFQVNVTHALGYQGSSWTRSFAPFDLFQPVPAIVPVAPVKNPPVFPHAGSRDQKSNATFAALPAIWYYEYTLDRKYLRDRLYPLLKQLDAFWRDWMVFDGTRFVIQHSSAHEAGDDTNPNLDLGFIRKVEELLLGTSRTLGVDADLRPVWQDVLDRLSAYPTGIVNGKEVYLIAETVDYHDPTKQNLLFEPGNQPINMEGGVFPGENISIGGDPHLLQVALNSLDQMNSWAATPEPSGGTHNGFPKIFPIAARAGWPADDLLARFKTAILFQWRPTNLTVEERGGGIETMGSIEGLDSMLMQSEGGAVRLFPDWPASHDASFTRLRAKGAFVVSSELRAGRVRSATVTSEAGGTLRLADPWSDGRVRVVQVGGDEGEGRAVRFTLSGGVISFRTQPGATYRVTNGEEED
jgi:hypothetical protein